MLRDVLEYLDYSVSAEIALMIFTATFCLVVIRTLRANPIAARTHAAMALDDPEEENFQ